MRSLVVVGQNGRTKYNSNLMAYVKDNILNTAKNPTGQDKGLEEKEKKYKTCGLKRICNSYAKNMNIHMYVSAVR